MKSKLFPFLTAAVLTGCVSNQSVQPFWMVKNNSPSYFAEQVIVEESDFEKCASISTPFYVQNPRLLMGQGTEISFKFRAIGCGDAQKHQLYLRLTYDGDWRFYNQATDNSGNQLTFAEISSDLNDCRATSFSAKCELTEDMGITLNNADLKEGAIQGFKFQLRAKSGDKTVIEIPAAFVDGYQDGYNRSKAK